MKMKIILIDKMKLMDDVVKRSYSRKSLDLILDQPEVEAIPIEWIEKWIDKNTELETLSIDGVWDIQEMIEDWGKENETN